MKTQRSNVLVHMDHSASRDRLQAIKSSLKSQPGVIDARPAGRLPCSLFVHYDPARANSQGILATVRRHGVAARLVGM